MRLLGLLLLALPLALAAARPPGHAVASAHPLATEAGMRMLEAGGNAFDAAVAVSAALAVVEPAGSGLGGGGFYLLHQADSGRKIMIDARETAPLAASADMYLDEDGAVNRDWLSAHPLASGIPGVPAALEHLARQYGSLPLKTLLAPAIEHAREGFAVDAKLARVMAYRADHLRRYPASAAIFMADGQPLAAGEILRQTDLAQTLERIATFGAAGFYSGRVAKDLVAAVRADGGIWTARDLKRYAVVERAPVIIDHRGWRIVSAPPPSSGGLVLGLMFNLLSAYDWPALAPVDQVHLSVEAMRRAYLDRARFMGDSDFVTVPSASLLSADYARQWRETIDPARATPSERFAVELPVGDEGEDTTHFSVIDAAGNRVAGTLSLNYLLGNGFVAAGTGVLLNNEMDDFVAKPGEPNAYGLVGGQANAIEPGKRMLSSMTPTFVEGADRTAVLGTPGGSRIITMVYHAIQGVIAGASAQDIVAAGRYHHQYLPDVIQHEPGALSAELMTALEARGHTLRELDRRYGNFQAIIWHHDGRLEAAADPRGVGSADIRLRAAPAGH